MEPTSAKPPACLPRLNAPDTQRVSRCAHILFTRVPVPGKVKTRLSSVLSDDDCALLQRALIMDEASVLAQLDGRAIVCYSDEHERLANGEALYASFMNDVRAASGGAQYVIELKQAGADLGARMRKAIEDALAMGAESCLLIGSDLPYLASALISEAEALLSSSDVVLGPCTDGGYWLVGMKEPFPELFECDRYGGSRVLEDAISVCARHGKTLALGPMTSDLDTPEDLKSLSEHVLADDERIGARTRRVVLQLAI